MHTRGTVGAMPAVNPFGWLRDSAFDTVFVGGVLALALLSGWLSVANPRLFPIIFLLDIWILAYHHVIATFTRLAFDLESIKDHRFLITWLPILVIVGTGAALFAFGPWILATTYFYWQWFHYTRQAYGVARIYSRKNNPSPRGNRLLEQLTIYCLPIFGILYRSWQRPGNLLGMEMKVLPVPSWLVVLAGIASSVTIIWWTVDQVVAYKKGEMKLGYTLFVLSHLIVFLNGYILIENINYGWLCLNVWHNAQYVMLVWMFNNNRFKNGIDPGHRFLSTISQTENMVIYYALCLCLSTFIYFSTSKVLAFISITALPLTMIFYQAINFHHYIVDAVIWKLRQKPVRNAMGLVE